MRSEAQIIATGRHLAQQVGGTFTVDARKLKDFRAYRLAHQTAEERDAPR